MLRDLDPNKYQKIYLACGYTDLRKGSIGLMNLIGAHDGLDPFDKNAIFLFCGRNAKTIKAIVFEGDGMLLLSKRLSQGCYQWPRTPDEIKNLTYDQFRRLMEGLTIEQTYQESHPL